MATAEFYPSIPADKREVTMFPKRLYWYWPSKIGQEKEAEAAFQKEIKQAYPTLSEDEVNDLSTGFKEIFDNALYHGNLKSHRTENTTLDEEAKKKLEGAASLKLVKVTLVMDQNGFEVTISDEGEGFDPNEVPDPTTPEGLKKNSGRGLFFARAYYDNNVKIINTGQGMKVVLKKVFKGPDGQEQGTNSKLQ